MALELAAAVIALALTVALAHQVVSAWSVAQLADADPRQTAPACRRAFHRGRPVQLDEHGQAVMYTD